MCGIAGYSLDAASSVDRTLAAQALLAGIAERGADAVGYAHRGAGSNVTIHKQRSGATRAPRRGRAARRRDAGPRARSGLHEGPPHDHRQQPPDPARLGGRHPQRHHRQRRGDLRPATRFERAEPDMTVDSEAIFALMEATAVGSRARSSSCDGSMATAWIDERRRAALYLARGVARPLWIGRGRREVFFASTKSALEVVEGALRAHAAQARGLRGPAARISSAAGSSTEPRFRTDRSYRDEHALLPSVRSPHEGASCLAKLAARRDGQRSAARWRGCSLSPEIAASPPSFTASRRRRR